MEWGFLLDIDNSLFYLYKGFMNKPIETLGNNTPQLYCLRCYKCDFECEKNLTINDSVIELDCPKCFKQTLELNLGKKPKSF